MRQSEDLFTTPPLTPEPTTGCCEITIELLRLRLENRKLKLKIQEMEIEMEDKIKDAQKDKLFDEDLNDVNFEELFDQNVEICGKLRNCGFYTCGEMPHEVDCQDCVVYSQRGEKFTTLEM